MEKKLSWDEHEATLGDTGRHSAARCSLGRRLDFGELGMESLGQLLVAENGRKRAGRLRLSQELE